MSTIQFFVGRGDLLQKLKLHRNVSNAPMIPILENVKMVIRGNVIDLVTSNLKQVIETSLSLASEVDEYMEICAPYKPILSLLESLPEQGLSFSYNPQDFRLNIQAAQGKYEFCGENPVDFPKNFPSQTKSPWLTMPSSALIEGLSKTLYAVYKKEEDDFRAAYTGVLFEDNIRFNLAATNGYMVQHTIVEPCESVDNLEVRSELLSSDGLSVLLSILPKDQEVQIHKSERFVWVECDLFSFSTLKMEERFPDYRNAVPTNLKHKIEINRAEWLSALGRMALFVAKDGRMVIDIQADSVSLEMINKDAASSCRENLTHELQKGEPMKIGLSLGYLRDALRHITSEVIELEYDAPNRPIILRDNDNYTLIMPMVLL